MAVCHYCGKYISATLCQKYFDHLEVCGKWKLSERRAARDKEISDRNSKIIARLEAENKKLSSCLEKALSSTKPSVNISIAGDFVMGDQYKLSLEYPQTSSILRTLERAKGMTITEFDTTEKINERLLEIENAHNGEVAKLLYGPDCMAKKQALTFVSDVMSIFYQRLRRERPSDTLIVEAVSDYIEEVANDKKLIKL